MSLRLLQTQKPDTHPTEYKYPDKVKVTRVVMLNMLALLINEYSNEEIKSFNFNIPLQSIRAYLVSNYFQSTRIATALVGAQKKNVSLDSIGMETEAEGVLTIKPEMEAITSILSRFAFANEDIMR